jgi:4-carboxymuconolactone decarboxylase
MTKPSQTLGGRLPLADPTKLTDAQRQLVNAMNATQVPWAHAAGFEVTNADGQMIGPYNSFLLDPEVGAKVLELSAAQKNTTLSRRVREVVIIAVGAVWGADYELYAHCALARNAGFSEHAVTTLANGGIPDDLDEHETIAARLARELSSNHRVDDELYRAAEKAFGATGLFDIVALMGQYHLVCCALNLFEVPAPSESHG